jgi:hypothetical protein
LPWLGIMSAGKVGMLGAGKHGEANWHQGMPWSWHLDAIMRHAGHIARGELIDPESGEPHASHIGWDGLALAESILRGLPDDDLSCRADPKAYLAKCPNPKHKKE